MNLLLDGAKTYSCDKALFSKLGLKQFSIVNQKEHFVGEYKLPEYETGSIKVWVTCMPAMFWRFEILTIEGKHFRLTTGSGALQNYWPSVMLVAEGMIELEPGQ